MLTVPVYSMKGKQTGEIQLEPDTLGGRVRPRLMKQAIVAYRNHQRQDSARTKRRSDVVGSTRKLYRQKGTGNARAGMLRTPVRRGGGRTFGKRDARAVIVFPKKMRRLACHSAILAKIRSNDVIVVDDFHVADPKTKIIVGMFSALGVDSGCILAMHERDRNVFLATRNIPAADVRVVGELNTYEVLLRRKLVFTKPAFEQLVTGPVTQGSGGTNE